MPQLTCDTLEEQIGAAIRADDMAELDRLVQVLDELDKPKPVVPLLAAALWYAGLGLPVFPLRPRSKIPHPGTRGVRDASSDADVIREAWQRHPESNIGLATGHLVDVIDVDGAAGVKSWSELIGAGALPEILGVVSTPRPGGSHLHVAACGVGNRAGLYPGIDYRGLGGYVVAPPSTGPDGTLYRWHRPLDLSAAGTGA